MNDKRSYERLSTTGEVILRDESDNSVIAEGLLDNISYSGALVILYKEIEQNREVLIELKMDYLTNPVFVKGMVKHVKHSPKYKYPVFMIGVKFSETDKDKVEYIIKRIYARVAEKKRNQNNIEPPDFIAY